jgi:hypothetical protein
MRRRTRELEFQSQWGDLATYNAEVHRGIVHTEEWQAKMAEKQAAYDIAHGRPKPPPGPWRGPARVPHIDG